MTKQANMSEEARKQLLDRIEQLIEEKDFAELRDLLSASRSSDVAEVVEVLDEIARQILFDLLEPDDAGEVLEKIDEETRSEVMEDLPSANLGDIVATLPPDEAADVVGELSEEKRVQILEHIPDEESDQIEKLLIYDDDTAGGIMNPELVKVKLGETISDAIHRYREADPDEDFYYIFVVDDKGVFKGNISLPTLLRHPRRTPIAEVLEEQLPTVQLHADQEEIANTFRKNDLIVMPVVDEKGVLVGRITVDDVVDVMDEEAEEDVLVMAGTHPAELESNRPFRAASVRLPWLLTCLVGSMASALVYFIFRPCFSGAEWAGIIMFVPTIAAMAGNSGLQTSTIIVRGLATGDLAALSIGQAFVRESRIALVVASICAVAAGLFSALALHLGGAIYGLEPHKVPVLGIAVGIGMFAAILIATSLGLFLPFFFRRLGVDPAISSGPLITTANDAAGYLAYFSFSLLLLYVLG